MSTPADPWWIRAALTVQASLLWTAPSSFRQRFGRELRQVLRDRLRELQAGSPRERQVEMARLAWQGLRSTASLQQDAISDWPVRLRMLALSLVLLVGTLLSVSRETLSEFLGELPVAVNHGLLVARLALPADQWIDAQRELADQLLATGDAGDAAAAGLVLRHVQPLGTWAVTGAHGPAARLADLSLRDRVGDALATMRAQGEQILQRSGEASDERALWLAYLYCGKACDRSATLTRWAALAPDNGYVQMLRLMGLAATASSVEVDALLQQIAESARYKSPHGDLYRRLSRTADTVEPGWALAGLEFPDGLTPNEALAAFASYPLALPPLQRWIHHCSAEVAAQIADRFALCDAALARMARDSSEPVDQLVALRVRAQLHGLGSAAHQAYRDASYLLQGVPREGREETRALLSGEPLLAWRRAQRVAAGLPVRAPAEFRDRLQE
jgi:hypothetical protein